MTHEQKIQQVRRDREFAREAGAEVAVSLHYLDRLEDSHAELLAALERAQIFLRPAVQELRDQVRNAIDHAKELQ
jgi:hypothetical protein